MYVLILPLVYQYKVVIKKDTSVMISSPLVLKPMDANLNPCTIVLLGSTGYFSDWKWNITDAGVDISLHNMKFWKGNKEEIF